MPSYKTLYHKTFNAITDAHRLLEQAEIILKSAQQECEKIYVDASDTAISLVKISKNKREPE